MNFTQGAVAQDFYHYSHAKTARKRMLLFLNYSKNYLKRNKLKDAIEQIVELEIFSKRKKRFSV